MTEYEEQEEQDPGGPHGTPEEGEHLSSPGEGYPAGETEPESGDVPDAEHPEDIGSTPSDDQGEEDVTESPGEPADPESG